MLESSPEGSREDSLCSLPSCIFSEYSNHLILPIDGVLGTIIVIVAPPSGYLDPIFQPQDIGDTVNGVITRAFVPRLPSAMKTNLKSAEWIDVHSN